VDGPLIMVVCVAIGLATSLILIIGLLFVSRDIDTIITSGAGPLLQIFYDATNSNVGSICLLLFVFPPRYQVTMSDGYSFLSAILQFPYWVPFARRGSHNNLV
jgi:hypothetical protein